MTVSDAEKSALNTALGQRIEALAQYLFPDGKKLSGSWRVGSFDINLRTGLWGDWDGQTSGHSRNLIDLWIHATGSDFVTAIGDIRSWLGVAESHNSACDAKPRPKEPERKLIFPLLEKPTSKELQRLSVLRSIAVEPLEIAVERGFLWCSTISDHSEKPRCWLLTDLSRKLAVARRLDGRPWSHIGGKKAKLLAGSRASWPLGIIEAQQYSAIALVEGGPDFLSAIAHARASGVEEKVAPVMMAGAGMSIPESVLPKFRAKRVRVFTHDDRAGWDAAERWIKQLTDIDAEVDGYEFSGLIQTDGSQVKDFNDLLRVNADCWEHNCKVIESLMHF